MDERFKENEEQNNDQTPQEMNRPQGQWQIDPEPKYQNPGMYNAQLQQPIQQMPYQVPQYQNMYQYGYTPYQAPQMYPPQPYIQVVEPSRKNTGWIVFAVISAVIAFVLLITVILQSFNMKLMEAQQGNETEENDIFDGFDPFDWFNGGDTDTSGDGIPDIIEDDYPGDPSISSIGGELPSITNPYNPVPEIVESTKNSVGEVIVYDHGTPTASGTGFVVNSAGYIVTNYHVARCGDSYTFVLDKEDITEIPARFVGGDATQDIAVLKADVDYLVPLALGSSSETKTGELAVAIGCIAGASTDLPFSVTVGHVSYVGRKAIYLNSTKEFLQIDTPVNPGNSGGPLFNSKGEVIGIVTWKSLISSFDEYGNAIDSEGIGFAIQIDDVKEQIVKIIQSGSIVRPAIGIIYQEVTEDYAKENNVPMGKLVTGFMAASPSESAGMQINDIIIKCNGTDLREDDILGATIAQSQIGDKVEVTVWRNGQEIDINIIIGDMNRMMEFE